MSAIMAIDQGTTSSRSVVFEGSFKAFGVGQQEFTHYFLRSGWVEHDPEDIGRTTLETARPALSSAGISARDVAALGITNQRETTIVWDRATGQTLGDAIVWQDRRTAEACTSLKAAGLEPLISERTGLVLDPYFSGIKIAWILDSIDGARTRAEAGQLAFGTVDSFLLWRLTGGGGFTRPTVLLQTPRWSVWGRVGEAGQRAARWPRIGAIPSKGGTSHPR